MVRHSLSLRTQLVSLLIALVLIATASFGSLAYSSSRAIMEGSAVREVAIAASARQQALIREITGERARAAALLKTAGLGCEPDETPCLRKVLADYVATGGATAARLVYRGRPPILAGPGAAGLVDVPLPTGNQVAHFERDSSGRPFYVVGALATSEDGPARIELRGDMQLVDQIFQDNYGLGQSGETFLTDTQGRFLTPLRYHAPSDTDSAQRPRGDQSIRSCLAGANSEALDRDYRDVAVIHGFRNVPQIGGGCVVVQIDQSEAFAPANALRKRLAAVSGLLAALAICCSLLFAHFLSLPIHKLGNRARSLQKGDYDSPVPAGGPSEVRMFAQTFKSMASSLKDSRMALLRSSEQITDILESMSEGFCAFDHEWKCTYVNARAAALSRVPREQLLGKTLWELLPAEIGAEVSGPLRRALDEQTPAQFEQHYAPFDAWFEVNAYPTRDGLAVFGRDVSERKRFNERLQQTQRLEGLGVLAGGIAHDFNNLLTGIMANASMILEDLPSTSPLKNEAQNVVDATERAAILTRQLLAYAGKAKFVIEPLDLAEAVRKISNLIRSSMPKTVALRLELKPGLPAIDGDAAQIQQLVMNLVINGAEAIGDEKPGTVTVTTSVKDVDEVYLRQTFGASSISPGRYVLLEVDDTGSGMDEATLARIFDPFFTTKFAGRGLGLAAVMGIVRGHKGALRVYSSPGQGSSFKVLFPASQSVAVSQEAGPAVTDLQGTGTILVIDDEEVVRQIAKSALTRYGYTVLAAQNGPEGIEIFQENAASVSLILLDMTMPAMSGEATLRKLRTVRADVPVIFCSGYHEVEFEQRFATQELAGFLQKPFTAAYLAERVKLALSRTSAS
ncbi:MAG TPA: response regulator [Bryobacteraceae bacterium]|nr:response regulator [Bryobacteraceae bacterium]